MTYQHTDEDVRDGYLPFDGMGRPISRRHFDEVMASAPLDADPEDLRQPCAFSLDYIRSV